MITFIHAITGQINEVADDKREWFLSSVADPEHWIDQDAPAVVAPAEPVAVPESTPEVVNDAI